SQHRLAPDARLVFARFAAADLSPRRAWPVPQGASLARDLGPVEKPFDAVVGGARLAVLAADFFLERGADFLDLEIGQVLDANKLLARVAQGADQLVELGLHCGGVAVLR